MATTVIAECGSCGDGQLRKMVALIHLTKVCGATVAKFQWTSNPAKLAARRAAGPDYERVYRQYIAWPKEWHAELAATCASLGLGYACTAYLEEDIPVVAPHVALFKVASFEAGDYRFIRAHREHVTPQKPVFISTGMQTLREWQTLVDLCVHVFPSHPRYRFGADEWDGQQGRVGLLHCTSAYPAPLDELQLGRLRWMTCGLTTQEPMGCVGLSDHADPAFTWIGALAVAAGAKVLEKHIRLDETEALNPDRPHAMTGEQFSAYVQHVRFAETVLGSGTERTVGPAEAAMLPYRVTA
jgi:sialic acid synthase SpsE